MSAVISACETVFLAADLESAAVFFTAELLVD
jgi:hypothetical protein